MTETPFYCFIENSFGIPYETINAPLRMHRVCPLGYANAKEDPCHKITADEAKKMMEEGGVTVVDVRTAEEYEQKHIPGAILVPNESMKEGQPEALPDLDAVLLIHCRTGVRSKQASDKLASLGYRHIYDFGGIVDWPYETESGAAN